LRGGETGDWLTLRWSMIMVRFGYFYATVSRTC
jgi:hypothetical protein